MHIFLLKYDSVGYAAVSQLAILGDFITVNEKQVYLTSMSPISWNIQTNSLEMELVQLGFSMISIRCLYS